MYCSKDGKTRCNEILNTYRACLETYGLRTTINESRLDADIYVIEHDNEEAPSLPKKVDIPKTTHKPCFAHLKRVYGQYSAKKYQNDLRIKTLAALKQKRYTTFQKFQSITNILLKCKV